MAAAAAASGGSYNLPAPSSSGSIDISGIKPTNSGIITYDDLYGKAHDAGYDDRYEDRYDNRFQDDERRRRRSPSPYRGRETDRYRFPSPGRRERSPLGGQHTDTIIVKTQFVGLVIGRGGDTLKMIEHDSGARVQFITNGKEGPERACNISGTREQVADARDEILRMIDDAVLDSKGRPIQGTKSNPSLPPQPMLKKEKPRAITPEKEEPSVQILVPDKTVGLIIGKGGETIREIQDRCGCHINIVSESYSVNGMRPVNLLGDPEKTAKARAMIEEIVESDQSRDAAAAAASLLTSQQQSMPDSQDVREVMLIPADNVGMLIGKGGEIIRDMQASTMCKITINTAIDPSEPEREVIFQGSADAVARARDVVNEKLELEVWQHSFNLFLILSTKKRHAN